MDKLARIEDVKMDLTLSQVGTLFAKSGMFTGIKDEAQALTKILAGRELGFSPFTAMSDLHIVQGKMTIGAHLFAARLKEHPRYDFEVKKHDDESCVIAFFEVSKRTGQWQFAGESEFSMKDAKKAGLVKSGSGWEKSPRNMLYARAMSNGCKWYAPDLFQASTYTLGEIQEPMKVENIIEGDGGQAEIDATLEKAYTAIVDLWDAYNINDFERSASIKKHLFVDDDLRECRDIERLTQYLHDKELSILRKEMKKWAKNELVTEEERKTTLEWADNETLGLNAARKWLEKMIETIEARKKERPLDGTTQEDFDLVKNVLGDKAAKALKKAILDNDDDDYNQIVLEARQQEFTGGLVPESGSIDKP